MTGDNNEGDSRKYILVALLATQQSRKVTV
ncbi:hypothetical protein EZS27_027046 [termite gut metagenome]|uniref:Uncharacterized protein n=1 Tax=termite gut metagenome TaxID=433724 RepID=A0A5J4QR54_9ZZZZ